MAASVALQRALVSALCSQGEANELVSIINTAAGITASLPLGSAYTQTYTTAGRTVAEATTHTITDSSLGTPSTTALAAQSVATTGTDGATPSEACTKISVDAILVVIRNNISTLKAELTLAVADILALKKNVTAILDDLQSGGILS